MARLGVRRTCAGILATGVVLLSGCALWQGSGRSDTPGPGKPVALQVCLATPDARAGYRALRDEEGQVLFAARDPLLTEADVLAAGTLISELRSLVRIEFAPPAADLLERATAEHIGDRLAIFIDGRLVMSPPVRGSITTGKVLLDGNFTPAEAARIARGLTRGGAAAREAAASRPAP